MGIYVGSSVSVSKHQFPALDKSVLFTLGVHWNHQFYRQLLEIIADEISFCFLFLFVFFCFVFLQLVLNNYVLIKQQLIASRLVFVQSTKDEYTCFSDKDSVRDPNIGVDYCRSWQYKLHRMDCQYHLKQCWRHRLFDRSLHHNISKASYIVTLYSKQWRTETNYLYT